MSKIGDLPPPPKANPKAIRKRFPPIAKTHRGKMKVDLIRNVITSLFPDSKPAVGDPMIGAGSTLIAADMERCKSILACDKFPPWPECCAQIQVSIPTTILLGDSSTLDLQSILGEGYRLDLILTSPPFPNAHSQGDSEMQKGLLEEKQTYAGNDFDMQKDWCDRPSFVRSLSGILKAWCPFLSPGGKIAIHIKNHVEDNVEVRVDEWVEEAILQVPGVAVLGYLVAPLTYLSLNQQNRVYPLRNVLSREITESSQIDQLECTHRKVRKKIPKKAPKRAHCVPCGAIPGVTIVREERIVVAQSVA